MTYNTLAVSEFDTVIIKSEMNKSQLLNQVFNILNAISDDNDDVIDDKLIIDVTIVTAESRHMTQAGQHYCSNEGLIYIIDKYDDKFSNYSLFIINTVNHVYIICPGSF